MDSVLVWSTSTKDAAEREFDLRIVEEKERIAELWEVIPVEVAPGDIDYKYRYRTTGEIVFQPDVTLLSY